MDRRVSVRWISNPTVATNEPSVVTYDPLEAHFVRSLLERQGIAAEVRGEALFGLRPEIGISSDTLPVVWITEDAQLTEHSKL